MASSLPAPNAQEDETLSQTQNTERKCPFCVASHLFAGNHTLDRHIRASHPSKTSADLLAQGMTGFEDCPHCQAVFRGLNRHRCTDECVNGRAALLATEALRLATAPALDNDPPPLNGQTTAEIPALSADSLEDLQDLLSHFQEGLFRVHHTWRSPLNFIASTLITQISILPGLPCARSLTALLLLPALLITIPRHNKSLAQGARKTPVQFLREVADSPPTDFAAIILARAMTARTYIQQREAHVRAEPSVERLVKRIESLSDNSRFNPAVRTLDMLARRQQGEAEPFVPQPTVTQVKAIINRLHPAATEEDELPGDGTDDPPGLVLDRSLVEKTIYTLQHGKANGSSGWTNRALQAIATFNHTAMDISDPITKWFQRCMNGDLPFEASAVWSTSRAVLLPKGNDWRPLGIGETWYRLLSRIANASVVSSVRDQVMPLQLCCGTPKGVEFAARMAQLVHDIGEEEDDPEEATFLLSLDVKNAFNSMRRRMIWDGLATYCPSLLRWFRCFYGHSSALRLSNGSLVGKSQSGVRQGDPLASLCFSVGLQPVLLELLEAITVIVGARFERDAWQDNRKVDRSDDTHVPLLIQQHEPRFVGLFAFADDTNLYGPGRYIEEMGTVAVKIFRDHGLEIVPAKTKIVGYHRLDWETFEQPHGGHIIMGNPVGSLHYRRETIRRMIEEDLLPLNALDRVRLQTGYALLATCIQARPQYLCRVADEDCSLEAMHEFDDRVLKELLRIAGPSHPSTSDRSLFLKSLPLKLGGFGLSSHSGIDGSFGKLMSATYTRVHLQAYPALARFADRANTHWKISGDLEDILRDHSPPPNPDAPPPDPLDDLSFAKKTDSTLRKAIQAHYISKTDSLIDHLRRSNSRNHAAWLLSSRCDLSGRFLNWRGGFGSKFSFTDTQFRDAVRLRLLLPAYENNARVCGCRQHISLQDRPLHFLDCAERAGILTKRHNMVRDLVHAFIKENLPITHTISKEVDLVDAVPGDPTSRRIDLLIDSPQGQLLIDIGIVNPACQSYVTKGSDTTPHTACSTYASFKRSKYKTPTRDTDDVEKFLPFIIEATGNLSPDSINLLRKHTQHTPFLRSYLLSSLSAVIAMYTVEALDKARRSSVPLVGG